MVLADKVFLALEISLHKLLACIRRHPQNTHKTFYETLHAHD